MIKSRKKGVFRGEDSLESNMAILFFKIWGLKIYNAHYFMLREGFNYILIIASPFLNYQGI